MSTDADYRFDPAQAARQADRRRNARWLAEQTARDSLLLFEALLCSPGSGQVNELLAFALTVRIARRSGDSHSLELIAGSRGQGALVEALVAGREALAAQARAL